MRQLKNNPDIVENEGIETVEVVAVIHKDKSITLEPVKESQ